MREIRLIMKIQSKVLVLQLGGAKKVEVAILMFIQVLPILCLVCHKHVSLLGTNRKINPLIE